MIAPSFLQDLLARVDIAEVVGRHVTLKKAGANHNTPKAKAICATCPVADECLQYALDAGETRGIWGGVAIDEHRRSPEHRKVPTPLPHGTNAGYVRERRQGLPHCADCIAARNIYRRALHARSAA